MWYLDTNYWKNGVILKFRVFTENFQLIVEMRREKILDGVSIFINLIKCIELYFHGNLMGWDGTGINCYEIGMGQKNMSHGQAWKCSFHGKGKPR